MRNAKNFKKSTKSEKTLVTQLERDEKRSIIRLQPIQWEAAPVTGGTARYVATSALNLTTMTIKDLISVPGIFATTTVLAYPVSVAVRMKRIRVWGFVATAGTPVTVAVQKAGIDSGGNDFNDSFRKVQDSSNSFDRPAFIELNFDKFSPSGSFHTNENVDGNLLYVTAPSGAIIDIDYNYVWNGTTSLSPMTYVVTTAAGTVGRFKILSANCSAVGVNNLN
jgi:hypothetical protein